jgi:hypothetical protein
VSSRTKRHGLFKVYVFLVQVMTKYVLVLTFYEVKNHEYISSNGWEVCLHMDSNDMNPYVLPGDDTTYTAPRCCLMCCSFKK